jgi:hypothetical protein
VEPTAKYKTGEMEFIRKKYQLYKLLFSVLLSANRLQLAFEVEKILENRLTQKI